jgi:hypothetical protein
MATRISQQGREVQTKILWNDLTNSWLPQNVTKILHLHRSNYRSGLASRDAEKDKKDAHSMFDLRNKKMHCFDVISIVVRQRCPQASASVVHQ